MSKAIPSDSLEKNYLPLNDPSAFQRRLKSRQRVIHINTIAEEEITKMIELQILLLKKNGVDVSNDKELELMLEPVDTKEIEKIPPRAI